MKIPSAQDPLGEALHFLRMSGVFYARSEFTAPWALALPAFEDCLIFHAVTSGRCVLDVDGFEDRVCSPAISHWYRTAPATGWRANLEWLPRSSSTCHANK